MKKKYRDKVRQRLQLVHTLLLADPQRVKTMMQRVGEFGKGSDFHNKFTALRMLLEIDVPALLDALDNVTPTSNTTVAEDEV